MRYQAEPNPAQNQPRVIRFRGACAVRNVRADAGDLLTNLLTTVTILTNLLTDLLTD